MIVSRSPLRISLAGGGSDLPSFYRQDFGEVLSFAINKYVYLAGHDYFAGGIRLSYSRTESVRSISEIQHPIFRNTLDHLNFDSDIELSSFADVPGSGTGLGSSSAFTVSLLNLLSTYSGTERTQEELASLACKIEIDLCGDPIGKQDQYASAIGGLNRIRFNKDDSVNVTKLSAQETKSEFLNESLLLFYSGIGRSASLILSEQNKKIKENSSTFEAVRSIREGVNDMESCINQEDAHGLGNLLSQNWQYKKKLANQISTPEIDDLFELANKCGALGGKIVGAGGGGFLLLCIEPGGQFEFQKRFNLLRNLPFRVEREGATIVYSDEVVK